MMDPRLQPILEEFGIPVGHCEGRTGCPYPEAVCKMAQEIDQLRDLLRDVGHTFKVDLMSSESEVAILKRIRGEFK